MYRKSALLGNLADVDGELRQIERSQFDARDSLLLRELHAAPKVQNGLVVYADGTDWDPGSGRGVYVYKGNAWVLLG